MLDLDEQIHRLADHAFDATSPILIDHSRPSIKTRHRRFATIAAAALIGVLGMGSLASIMFAKDSARSSIARLEIDDPLSIDLDDAIEISDQQRVHAIGPLLTFDFTALPAG